MRHTHCRKIVPIFKKASDLGSDAFLDTFVSSPHTYNHGLLAGSAYVPPRDGAGCLRCTTARPHSLAVPACGFPGAAWRVNLLFHGACSAIMVVSRESNIRTLPFRMGFVRTDYYLSPHRRRHC